MFILLLVNIKLFYQSHKSKSRAALWANLCTDANRKWKFREIFFLCFCAWRHIRLIKKCKKREMRKERERKRERATYTQRQPCIKNILDNRRGDREHIPLTGRQSDAQPVWERFDGWGASLCWKEDRLSMSKKHFSLYGLYRKMRILEQHNSQGHYSRTASCL